MNFDAARRAPIFNSFFARDDRGLVAVEFALILPVMLVIYFGVTEISQVARASQKVDQIARTLADLTARKLDGAANGQAAIMQGDLTGLLRAARVIIAPLPENYLRFEVDELETFSASPPYPRLRWIFFHNIGNRDGMQRSACGTRNEPGQLPKNEFNTIPSSLASGQSSKFIIAARVQYDYGNAVLPKMFAKAIKLVSWNYAVPRALPPASSDNPLILTPGLFDNSTSNQPSNNVGAGSDALTVQLCLYGP